MYVNEFCIEHFENSKRANVRLDKMYRYRIRDEEFSMQVDSYSRVGTITRHGPHAFSASVHTSSAGKLLAREGYMQAIDGTFSSEEEALDQIKKLYDETKDNLVALPRRL